MARNAAARRPPSCHRPAAPSRSRGRNNGWWAETDSPSPRFERCRCSVCSWDAGDAERGQCRALAFAGELLLLLLVSHVKTAAFMLEAEVVHAQDAQAEADLGADRIQVRVERFLRDAELRDAHRHDAVLAPDEE